MKKALTATLLALILAFAAAMFVPAAQAQAGGKTVMGFVFNKADQPLPEAIVYLKNTKTLSVKTFIAGRDAAYRFTALSPNIDYELWAEFHGAKSDTKTVSSFDSRPQSHINLKVNTK
ncbi:MAG TPA: carboxypeptidase-like regulatory domain-containing protein [Terriglobales bacterium]|nr:carboxypeptidase-like regulatory domain-containing protein [Terriglobales bacterium]